MVIVQERINDKGSLLVILNIAGLFADLAFGDQELFGLYVLVSL